MFKSRSKSVNEEIQGATTIIGSGTIISGDVESSGDIRIDGLLKGNLMARSKIIIGPEGIVEGDIRGQQADTMGTVTGSITVNGLLHLRDKATLTGDVYAGKLLIEPTVTFNGKCHMGANIVELNSGLSTAVNQ